MGRDTTHLVRPRVHGRGDDRSARRPRGAGSRRSRWTGPRWPRPPSGTGQDGTAEASAADEAAPDETAPHETAPHGTAPEGDPAREGTHPVDATAVSVPATGRGTDARPEHPDGATVTIPTAPESRPRLRLLPRRRWLRRTLAALAAVVVLLAVLVTPSLGHALTRPGSRHGGRAARRVGPRPRARAGGDLARGAAVRAGPAPDRRRSRRAASRTPPAPSPTTPAAARPRRPCPRPPGSRRCPGEGQWQPVVSTPHGDAVRLTTVRPDAAHTSFLVGVLWMDPTLVRGVLHPGTEDPGGDWSVPSSVDADGAAHRRERVLGGLPTAGRQPRRLVPRRPRGPAARPRRGEPGDPPGRHAPTSAPGAPRSG